MATMPARLQKLGDHLAPVLRDGLDIAAVLPRIQRAHRRGRELVARRRIT
jgi:hypothetical protein